MNDDEPNVVSFVRLKLPNVRHQMWNGRWHAAIARLKTIYQGTHDATKCLGTTAGEHLMRFRKHLLDPRDDLVNIQASLTHYAHAYRHGLRISSAPAESGMSHIVNQRMGKRQPMCWSLEGAHLLLQMRCAPTSGRHSQISRGWRRAHVVSFASPPTRSSCYAAARGVSPSSAVVAESKIQAQLMTI